MNFSDFETFYIAGGVAYGILFCMRIFRSMGSKAEFHDGKTFKEWLDGEAQFVPEMLLAFGVALAVLFLFAIAVSTWPLALGVRIYKGQPMW